MANYDLTYEGSRVQNILDTGDELRDAGYIFRGEATPSTVPGTPTERVAYIGGPGTYTNFGSSTVVPSGSIGVFKYTGSAWSNQVIACTVPISTSVQDNDTTVPTGKAVKTAVDAEATARGNAISSEASARQLGDSTLQGSINTVSAAVTAINNAIGNGSVYAGIATPSSTPASGKVFYLAFTAGTYTNFNSLEVPQGINILKNNGSTWLLDSFLGIDDAPTQGSDNLVKSGGVLNSIIQNGPAFDLSAYNAQGGTLATYADLSAALTALNALPADFKKGGMSIKFVLSSDNKYVQFRLMSDEFTTDTTQWDIAEGGVYVDNPEFIYVKTDSEGKILWAIKADGSVYYGVGVPPQIVDYINNKIAELSLDEYEDIVAFLNGLEEGENTLQQLLNLKANKNNAELTGKISLDKEIGENDEVIETSVQHIDNPEFVAVWLDTEDKILFGVEQDGNFLFGCGVPKQVKDYIEQKIEELSLDEYESIVAFIGDYLNNTTLEELLSKKVDGEYVDNPEFIEAKTDADNKLTEATRKDGTKVIYGDLEVLGSFDIQGVAYKVVSNPEWLKVVLDEEDRVICGIRIDGTFCVVDLEFLDSANEIKDKLAFFDTAGNPEFMEVELDADDKVLGGRKADGTKFENNDVELNGNATVGGSLKVDGVVIKNIEDPDGRHEIILDSENKIIGYRRDDGTKVENVGIETPKVSTNSLELTEQGMTEFQQALKDAGFQPGGAGDWSDYISNDGKNPLQLPIPQIAKINFICDIASLSDLSKADRPDGQEGVNYDVPSYVEYWDTLGNYFKKPSKISGQGNSTMNDPMRSIAMDLFDSDGSDNAFAIKFGDWVAQDSFHVKAYYKDVTKGVSTISYKIGEVITKFLDARANRLSKNIFNISAAGGSGKAEYDYSTNALCHPDGFPVEVYHNGNYYGLSVLSLKKHRMNYSMDKNDYTSVLIDNIGSFKWNNGTLNWSSAEFRNPKTLYCMDGTKYDGDNPKEIIDSTSQYYDSTNKNHVKSAEMKALVLSFLTAYGDIRNEQNVATRKNMWRQHFDIENTIAYIIFSNLTYNQDGWMNNAQISIYNNKMGFNIYDCDSCLGKSWNGTIWSCSAKAIVIGPSIHHGHILFYIANDFKDEIEAAYQALRDSKVIDVNNLSQFMIDWSNRIGYEAYKKSIDTWTNSPSYSLGNLNSEYWRQIVIGTEDLPSEYDDTVPYNKGDKCRIGSDLSYNTCIFECVKNTEPGQSPLTSGSLPTGCYDSPYRYKKWFTLRINVLDTYYNYNN